MLWKNFLRQDWLMYCRRSFATQVLMKSCIHWKRREITYIADCFIVWTIISACIQFDSHLALCTFMRPLIDAWKPLDRRCQTAGSEWSRVRSGRGNAPLSPRRWRLVQLLHPLRGAASSVLLLIDFMRAIYVKDSMITPFNDACMCSRLTRFGY